MKKKFDEKNISVSIHISYLYGKSSLVQLSEFQSKDEMWQHLCYLLENEKAEKKEQRCGFTIVDRANNEVISCCDFAEEGTEQEDKDFLFAELKAIEKGY